MKKFKVTSIGEILYDVYPDYKKLGGAPFNFIYHVWKLYGSANFVSRIGDDNNGKEIINYLESKKFDCRYIAVDPVHPTGTVNVKLLENKIPQFTISAESAWDFMELTDEIKELVKQQTDLFYFGTLSQRNIVTRNTIEKLLNEKIKYFSDMNLRHDFYDKKIIATALEKCNVIKINDAELNIVMDLIYQKSFSITDSAKKLIDDYNIDLLCVTLGADGAYLFSKTNSNNYKTHVQNLVDTVGAGDAYSAVLCLGYLHNWEVDKINYLATHFAADLCSVEGALPEEDTIYFKYKNEFNNE